MGGWVSPGRDGLEAVCCGGLGFPGQGVASLFFFFLKR